MVEVLLDCRLCGGKVSSGAISCPHCGSLHFKPDWFLQKEAEEKASQVSQQVKQCGSDNGLRVQYDIKCVNSRNTGLDVGIYNFSVDGKPLLSYRCSECDADDNDCVIRITPGKHQVSFVYTNPVNREKTESAGSFVSYPNSKRIVFKYRRIESWIKRATYRFDSVEVI